MFNCIYSLICHIFFFFQAEDGIRDVAVTGVQTCALPILVSRRGGKDVACASQLNAFIPVPYSPVTERTIQQQSDIHYYRDGDEIVLFGSAPERFANMFNAEARPPMAGGPLNPEEKQAWPGLEGILP